MKLEKRFSLTLQLPEDYNFRLTAAAYSFSWVFDGSNLRIVLDREGESVVCVREQERALEVEVYSSRSDLLKDQVVEQLVDVLGLEEDLTDFYIRSTRDLILRDPPRGLHIRKCDPWFAFLIAVSQQNASFRQGWYMLYRLVKNFGKPIPIEGRIIYIPPSPKKVLELGENALKACGYGYRTRIVLDAARRFVELDTDDLHRTLRDVKGVGPYTYGLACALAYREYNHKVIDRWVKGLYETLGVKNVEKYYEEVWGPWKAYATWMLTIVLDAVPLSKAIERVKRGEVKPTMQGLTPLTMWRYW